MKPTSGNSTRVNDGVTPILVFAVRAPSAFTPTSSMVCFTVWSRFVAVVVVWSICWYEPDALKFAWAPLYPMLAARFASSSSRLCSLAYRLNCSLNVIPVLASAPE